MATSTNLVIAAIKSRLEGSLPALVAAESLPAIVEVLNHYPGVVTLTKCPQIWIEIDSDSRSDSPERGASLKKYSQAKVIQIGIMAAGVSAEEAAVNTRAYVDLMRKCLEGDQTVGGTSLWNLWKKTNYSPVFKQGMAQFRSAILTCDVNRICQALGTD